MEDNKDKITSTKLWQAINAARQGGVDFDVIKMSKKSIDELFHTEHLIAYATGIQATIYIDGMKLQCRTDFENDDLIIFECKYVRQKRITELINKSAEQKENSDNGLVKYYTRLVSSLNQEIQILESKLDTEEKINSDMCDNIITLQQTIKNKEENNKYSFDGWGDAYLQNNKFRDNIKSFVKEMKDKEDVRRKEEESKYYIPSIEEFRIGFEFEVAKVSDDFIKTTKGGLILKWEKKIFKTSNTIIAIESFLNVGSIRVKYLDSEDLMNTGLGYDTSNPQSDGSYTYGSTNKKYTICHYPKTHRIEIMRHDYIGSDRKAETIFSGIIKNISELNVVLTQLEIN